MKKFWFAAVLLVFVLAGTAFARFGLKTTQTGEIALKRPIDYLVEKGISLEEYYTWRQSGKTFAEFLQKNNIKETDLKAEILNDRKATLDQLVKDDQITARERDARLVIMEENLGRNWNKTEFEGLGLGCGRSEMRRMSRNGQGRRF